MTDDWWDSLYHRAGEDMHNARIARLLNEFKHLIAGEKTNTQDAKTDSSPTWNETDGYF